MSKESTSRPSSILVNAVYNDKNDKTPPTTPMSAFNLIKPISMKLKEISNVPTIQESIKALKSIKK